MICPNWDFLFLSRRTACHTHVRTHWIGRQTRKRERERETKEFVWRIQFWIQKKITREVEIKEEKQCIDFPKNKKNNIILYKLDNSIRKFCLFIYRQSVHIHILRFVVRLATKTKQTASLWIRGTVKHVLTKQNLYVCIQWNK